MSGFGGFLLLFKVLVLPNISPEDELGPGIVMIAAILVGLVFAFAGRLVQHYFARKRN